MNINELFIMATRRKFRFPFKGQVSVEDLWDMSVRDLDSVFKLLNSQIKQANEESLLTTKSKEDTILEAQIAIVKYIVQVKQDDAAQAQNQMVQAEKKRRIMEIIANKQDAALQNLSVEELQKMLAGMDM